MKKLLALTLALAMALSLGVTAVAKDTPIPEGAKVVPGNPPARGRRLLLRHAGKLL